MTRPSTYQSTRIVPPGDSVASKLGPLSTLEAALEGPDADAHITTAQAQLNALELRCRSSMRQGVTPSDFAQLDALVQACTAASEILRQSAPPSALVSTLSIGALFFSPRQP